jgi:hypothetical protein
MKEVVLGMVVGALACFGVVRLTDRQVVADPAPQRLIAESATRPAGSDAGLARGGASTQALSDSAAEQRVVPAAMTDKSSAAPPPSDLPKAEDDWIERLSERQAYEICNRSSQLRQAREQAAKDAEPKDAGWAYPMEQLIRQHIEMHLPADTYTKLSVECHTSFCELRLESTGMDGKELADKVVQQIQHQQWSDIVQRRSGGGVDGETWYVEYDWFRPRTETERRTWFWSRDLQRR